MKTIAQVTLSLYLVLPLTLVSAETSPVEPPDRAAIERELHELHEERMRISRRFARLQRQLIDFEEGGAWQEVDPDSISDQGFNRSSSLRLPGQRQTRSLLGLLLGTEKDEYNQLLALTPGGAAERAGMRPGDQVVEINGQSVNRLDAESLQRPLQGTEPGDKVLVTVRRDGEELAFEVEAEKHPLRKRALVRQGLHRGPDGAARIWRESKVFHAADVRERAMSSPDGSGIPGVGPKSRLVSNNPDLAPYFGTGEGVIVLRIDADNSLGLAAGDVILAFNGEPIQRTVEFGMQLLRSPAGGAVSLRVMRAGSEIDLEAVIPEEVRSARDFSGSD